MPTPIDPTMTANRIAQLKADIGSLDTKINDITIRYAGSANLSNHMTAKLAVMNARAAALAFEVDAAEAEISGAGLGGEA